MKQIEYVETPHRLTWDNVMAALREALPHGVTVRECVDTFGAEPMQTRVLMQTMFDSGCIGRVKISGVNGPVTYFHKG